jgi:hypothetical protein
LPIQWLPSRELPSLAALAEHTVQHEAREGMGIPYVYEDDAAEDVSAGRLMRVLKECARCFLTYIILAAGKPRFAGGSDRPGAVSESPATVRFPPRPRANDVSGAESIGFHEHYNEGSSFHPIEWGSHWR